MKPSRERRDAAYIRKIVQSEAGRMLNPFFQGTVSAVQGSGPWLVQIIRTGETDPDGNEYYCPEWTATGNAARYVPSVGDRVQCVWAAPPAIGYVLFAVTPPGVS